MLGSNWPAGVVCQGSLVCYSEVIPWVGWGKQLLYVPFTPVNRESSLDTALTALLILVFS
ncbi:hypothetical protein [Synechococcus sp. M16CYN]|uniref:hypothetical protein n=1 Tax=Synechococcus sp. M16CYN TaxID=3103139 RepID=UPI00333E64EC